MRRPRSAVCTCCTVCFFVVLVVVQPTVFFLSSRSALFQMKPSVLNETKKKKENSIKLNEFSETSLHLINFPSPDLENAILNLTQLSLIFQERVNPGGALRSGCLSDSVRQSG